MAPNMQTYGQEADVLERLSQGGTAVIELEFWILEREVLEAVRDAATLGDIALVVTVVAGYLDPALRAALQQSVRERYQELTAPGRPDGPRHSAVAQR
jgi:hypothetical protein